ncbi:helix-turn-helix transcriptional regulator [Fructobacillus fructosus]|uniref:helix-turn-helix domain-containing protein n=1 Tax=Fructobacillus fructosus TaxID=1631 RepID=UPI002D985BC5|nr:Transcriptional regulator [Fructobacillus fructosus]
MKNNRIKQLRELNKISVLSLSTSLGIPQSTLTRYENGNIVKGKFPIWQKLANYFDVSIGYIQGTSDIEKPFDTNTMDEWWNKTINYMSDVAPQVFDAERKAHEQTKATEQVTPILEIISKNESLPDGHIDYNADIKDKRIRANIYKAMSSLAEIGRSPSAEAEADIQKITDLLENLERKTELPPELGGYDINKKTSDD